MTTAPITIVTALHGHTEASPYIVPDYPYGFRLRCQLRAWLEVHPKRGTRFVTQTSNPKVAALVWNKPKASTYAIIAGGMYLDAAGHLQWWGLSEYSQVADVAAFLKHWPEHARTLAPWVAIKCGHLRKVVALNERGESGWTMNGQPTPLRDGETERHRAELAEWDAVADTLRGLGALKPRAAVATGPTPGGA